MREGSNPSLSANKIAHQRWWAILLPKPSIGTIIVIMYWIFGILGSVVMVALFSVFLAVGIVLGLDVLKNKQLSEIEKLLWIIGMIVTFPLMTVLYYFIARSSIKKKY